MKKMIILFVVAATISINSNAQQDTSKIKTHHENHDAMKELNLTSEQQEKMKKLNADSKAKRDSITNNKSLSEEQKKEQLTSLKKESRRQVGEVLTAEQRSKLKEMKSQKSNSGEAADSTKD